MTMETHQQSRAPHFSLSALPPAFWYIVAASLVLALLTILFMVVQGYRDGLARGEAQRRQQAAILLQRGSDMLDAGLHDEALAVYERILEFDPENEAARSAILAVHASPTPEPVTVVETQPTAVDIEWAAAVSLYEEGRWQEAIQQFARVQSLQNDYRIEELEQRLFSAYVELARAVVAEGNLEEAVQLFDKALEIEPNDTQVRHDRLMIAHYVDVKTYWGADWTRVIRLLEILYTIDPDYRDVRYLLQRAHVEQGESLAYEEEWCAAAAEYTSAIAVLDWLDLRKRRDDLAALCRNATSG